MHTNTNGQDDGSTAVTATHDHDGGRAGLYGDLVEFLTEWIRSDLSNIRHVLYGGTAARAWSRAHREDFADRLARVEAYAASVGFDLNAPTELAALPRNGDGPVVPRPAHALLVEAKAKLARKEAAAVKRAARGTGPKTSQ